MNRPARILGQAADVLFVLLLLFAPAAVAAQTLTVPETEALVRASYFEGMPEAAAARIGPAGAERLVEMLGDSEERQNHAQILLALGLCGSPDAMTAILDWKVGLDAAASTQFAAAPPSVEIDRDRFKAWQALPYALGHLARFDDRAVAELEILTDAEAPQWTFRHYTSAHLHDLARRGAATSLALTGLPEARRALDRASRNLSDVRFAEHLMALRVLHAERARERAK